MKIVIEDMSVGDEIKISCNCNQSQDIFITTNGRDITKAVLKAIRGNDEEA